MSEGSPFGRLDPAAHLGFEDWLARLTEGPWNDPEDPSRRAGDALLALHRELLGAPDATPEQLDHLAEGLQRLRHSLTGEQAATRYRPDDTGLDGRGVVQPNSRGTHPIIGPLNPAAPPVSMRLGDDGRLWGDVVYDLRFEGVHGLVHGGHLAAAFDIVLGQAVRIGGGLGPTAHLAVHFRAGTPLHRPLRFESWFERSEGRKHYAAGLIRRLDTDQVTAEAEGLFVAPRPPEE